MTAKKFHSIAIEGIEFHAFLSADGPYIASDTLACGVALGHCTSICFLEQSGPVSRNQQTHWALVKYRNQERMDLSGLSERGRKRLADEFGIPIRGVTSEDEFFSSSDAFRGLCEWARRHPRLFAKFSGFQSYIPGWHDMVAEALNTTAVVTIRTGDLWCG